MMLMSQKNRNTRSKKWAYTQDIGGRHCNCCDPAFAGVWKKQTKRAMRRIEKREWKKETE